MPPRFGSVLLIGLLLVPALVRAASFSGLGVLPGTQSSFVSALSADGSTAVGTSGSRPFLWQGGALAAVPGVASGAANGLSADGSVVVGSAFISTSPSRAFRWSSTDGAELFAPDSPGSGTGLYPNTVARAVSGDGSVVVGITQPSLSRDEAFRWTEAGGFTYLGHLAGTTRSEATAISLDGSAIVGAGGGFGAEQGFRWTHSAGLQPLGDLPGGTTRSAPLALSADGSVVVGWSGSAAGLEAFRWTEADGMQGLGGGSGATGSIAWAISGDGSVIGGSAGALGAALWTEGAGWRSVNELLASQGILLGGWSLGRVLGLSFDGRVLVGQGVNPAGRSEGWIAVLAVPEASVLSLVGVGLAALGACRRR